MNNYQTTVFIQDWITIELQLIIKTLIQKQEHSYILNKICMDSWKEVLSFNH